MNRSAVAFAAVLLGIGLAPDPAGALVVSVPPCSQTASGECVQDASVFPIDVDGLFSDSEEWLDVSPRAFISPPESNGPLLPTAIGDPLANSFLYAAVAPGLLDSGALSDLYLMYSYHPRTNPSFRPDEFIADVRFPIVHPTLGPSDLTVEVRGADSTGTPVNTPDGPLGDSFFNVFFEVIPRDGTGAVFYLDSGDLPVGAHVGFGPSPGLEFADPEQAFDHLLVELEVLLRQTADGGVGDPEGVYSPAPAFWGADVANDRVDPPASAALFSIDPQTGSNTITPLAQNVPEPASLLLAILGLAGLALGRLRRGVG